MQSPTGLPPDRSPEESQDGWPSWPTRRSRRALLLVSDLASVAFLATGLLAFSGPGFWFGEILANLGYYLGVFGLVVAVLSLVARRWIVAPVVLALGLWWAWPELSLSLAARPDVATRTARDLAPKARLRVASFNLLFGNQEREGVLQLFDDQDPDLVFCCEVSDAWREFLLSMDRYPHRCWSPPLEDWEDLSAATGRGDRSPTWGTVVLSKRPFQATALHPVAGGDWRASIDVTVAVGKAEWVVRAAHPMRLGKAWRVRLRDQALAAFEDLDWSGPSLLIGDLNTTSSSANFDRLLDRCGLRDSRMGFGRQPSFPIPSWLPVLSVAIDHILVSDEIAVVDRRVVVIPGSDHRGVVADLQAR